jgi:hypothetical protein
MSEMRYASGWTQEIGSDPEAALAKYLRESNDWQAGRNRRECEEMRAVARLSSDLFNAFLIRNKERVALGVPSPLT